MQTISDKSLKFNVYKTSTSLVEVDGKEFQPINVETNGCDINFIVHRVSSNGKKKYVKSRSDYNNFKVEFLIPYDRECHSLSVDVFFHDGSISTINKVVPISK